MDPACIASKVALGLRLLLPAVSMTLLGACALEGDGNGLIAEFSTAAYQDCDRLASQIMRISYEDVAEEGGRFLTFLTRENNGKAMLYRLDDQDQFEIIRDDAVIAQAVYGGSFFGLMAIQAAKSAKEQSGESIAELVAENAFPANKDPRLILKTNNSLVCKIKFSTLGALPAGFYRVSEDEDSYYYEELQTD